MHITKHHKKIDDIFELKHSNVNNTTNQKNHDNESEDYKNSTDLKKKTPKNNNYGGYDPLLISYY